MWLTSSSVGRKFIMALTGMCLVLFVTFHCLMNSVAIVWPTAYNVICEFLGANWYALIASMGLAVLFIIHICYAVVLTLQNRRARGNDRYLISKTPATVEWSSKNMFVLGIVVLAFLAVHLINFWAKMQLVEIRGLHDVIPAAAGTLFIHEAFSNIWVPIIYIIGFIALWFHFNHGFWSMFQTIGWDSTKWIPRWKKISCCWTSIVIALFVIQAVVFTIQSRNNTYLENKDLREQYVSMSAKQLIDVFGQGIETLTYDQMKMAMQNVVSQPNMLLMQLNMQNPDLDVKKATTSILNVCELINYLEGDEAIDTTTLKAMSEGQQPSTMMGMPAIQGMQPQAEEVEPEQQAAPSPEQQAADEAPAQEPTKEKNNTNN